MDMTGTISLFCEDYQQSRARFRHSLETVRRDWPGAGYHQRTIPGEGDLTTDWIFAEGEKGAGKLLIVTTAEHGIEGYVGTAVLQRIIDRHLGQLNPSETALLLVHALNPWGMAHFRRTNANNVDLNRNFILDPGDFDPASNADYGSLAGVLHPQGPAQIGLRAALPFLARLVPALMSMGYARFKRALLLGQYAFPQGIYYGGESIQAETKWYQELFRELISRYGQVVHLDMHTGYGPRYQMSLVNSSLESRTSQTLEALYHYPQVVNTSADEFYAIRGDLIDYEYRVVQREAPDLRFYATTFEFGTLGDSLPASVQSMWSLILENQAHWYGCDSEAAGARIRQRFRQLFYPDESDWQTKAIQDADHAVVGILRGEGFVG
jgi:hypothetical protein